MKFSHIFVEKDVLHETTTQNILNNLGQPQYQIIDRIDAIFNRVKKPYLQKRKNLQLFIGKKRGQLLKQAPDAYGIANQSHYYFIHAYNCIFECQYCYLQGYFSSPDIVLFTNHSEIHQQIIELTNNHPDQNIWFHAGEFSDSLALNHITQEWGQYFDLFKTLPKAYLELRTKSANIAELLKINPVKNVIITFSLSAEEQIRQFDLKTSPLIERLQAMNKLQQRGFKLGVHFDPLIYHPQFATQFEKLLLLMKEYIQLNDVEYYSIGALRFAKDVFIQVKKNYPQSSMLNEEFITGTDGKIRYPKALRLSILKLAKQLLLENKVDENKLYFCMEDEKSNQNTGTFTPEFSSDQQL